MKIYRHVLHQKKARDKHNTVWAIKSQFEVMEVTLEVKIWPRHTRRIDIQFNLEKIHINSFLLIYLILNRNLDVSIFSEDQNEVNFGGHEGHTGGQYFSNESNYIKCEWSLSELVSFGWRSCLIIVLGCNLRYKKDKKPFEVIMVVMKVILRSNSKLAKYMHDVSPMNPNYMGNSIQTHWNPQKPLNNNHSSWWDQKFLHVG